MAGIDKIARAAAAFVAAVLLWAAFPPCGETAGLAFALAPLLAVSRLSSPGRSARTWFFGGFLFWFATLSWMPAIVKNGGPWPLVVLGWLGLAAICAGYFALFGWLDARLWRLVEAKRDSLPWLVLPALALGEPVLWSGCEWLRGTLFTGFAWNCLGTGVAHVSPLASPARIGGVYLVSALVVLVNGVFATLTCRVVRQMRREPRGGGGWRARALRSAETAVSLAAVLVVYGLAQGAIARRPVGMAPMRVALVQRNMPCVFSKATAENPHDVYGRLLDAVSAARPDLMVWAESAMAEFGKVRSSGALRAADRFMRMAGAGALLAGGDDVTSGPDGDRRVYNAAALYLPKPDAGVSADVYAKQHLVPFGEYVPFDKWITPLQRLSPIGVSLWPGRSTVFDVPLRSADGEGAVASVKVAPLICFEDTDPALSRAAARMGAQAIVLITNDSWFSNSHEAEQHAWQAVMRAVETGLPVIRVGNSGVTGVVSPLGHARWLSDGTPASRPLVDAPGVMTTSVPFPVSPSISPYVRFGDAPLLVLFAIALSCALWPARKQGAPDGGGVGVPC